MAKAKVSADEKFTNTEFDLFEAIEALDNKDYGYYDRLTDEQKKKFSAFMPLKYLSSIKGNKNTQLFHVLSANEYANKHLFNEYVQKHPKLQWLMLCAAGQGTGKKFHPYIPQIKENVGKLKEKATTDNIKEYFKKVYPKTDEATLKEISKLYVEQQHKKVYLANRFPEMKLEEIELLSEFVTDEEIKQYERDSGN